MNSRVRGVAMVTSCVQVSALIIVISTVGAESKRHVNNDAREQAPPSVSASPSTEGPSIVDIGTVATAVPDSLLGAEVVAHDVCVRELTNHGFWVTPDQGDARVFVHPAEGSLITVRVGESVTLHGEVRRMTTPMDRRTIPYVYAYTVRPAWPKPSLANAPAREQMCPH